MAGPWRGGWVQRLRQGGQPSPREPELHPLVLIHGMSSSARAWDPVLPFLRETREVHVITLPGHRGGPGLGRPDALTMLDFVDEVESELDRRGVPVADIVGNSLGGWVALQLAGRGRANSVVCLAPAGGWPVGGSFDRYLSTQFKVGYRFARRLRTSRAERLIRSPRVKRAFLFPMVAKPELISDSQFDEILADVAECPALVAASRRHSARDVSSVPASPCPVLVAWSERDRILMSRASRKRLERQIGSPKVVRLAGVGHVPMSDDPLLVADTILDFTSTDRQFSTGRRRLRSGGTGL